MATSMSVATFEQKLANYLAGSLVDDSDNTSEYLEEIGEDPDACLFHWEDSEHKDSVTVKIGNRRYRVTVVQER